MITQTPSDRRSRHGTADASRPVVRADHDRPPPPSPAQHGTEDSSRSVVLGKGNLLVACVGLLVLIGAYWLTLLPEALALLLLVLPPLMAASRLWHARRGDLEYGLLRHPFRRDLRPYLVQCLNHWLFLALFGVVVLTGAFSSVPALLAFLTSLPLPDRMPYQPLVIALGAGTLVMAGLALVPRRRVQIPTNVLIALGTAFLAMQLVRIYTPPADPVVLDPPLAGEWAMLAGGRSALLGHHYLSSYQRYALDFARLVEGRSYQDDPQRAASWYGFGEPLLAPADGTIVSVADSHPDEPVGAIGQTPPDGNHLILDIGDGRYAVMVHLQQGSARVSEGERVRRGQQLAAVGDSGNSLAPHLHFQVQDRPVFPDQQARTIPIVFRNTVLIRGGNESTPAEVDLRRGDRLRRIGD